MSVCSRDPLLLAPILGSVNVDLCLSLYSSAFLFFLNCINRIMQYAVFNVLVVCQESVTFCCWLVFCFMDMLHFVHSSDGQILAIVNNAVMNIHKQVFDYIFSVLLTIYWGVGLLCHMQFFNFFFFVVLGIELRA
jgi:hypothetical protein